MNAKKASTKIERPYLNRLVAYLIIVSAGILIYANTVHYPFVFDDKLTIIENKSIQSNEIFKNVLQQRYIGLLSFALNYKINGLNTFGYHLVNIAIHIINALLVYELFLLIISLTCNEKLLTYRYKISFFIGVLFLVHPVQTQAVTYIVQRFASLSALFVLVSTLTYIKFRSGNPAKYSFLAVSLIAALLAFKTKENTATLPLMLAIIEWLLFRKSPDTIRKRILYLVPYCILFIVIPLSFINVHKPLSSMPEEIISKSYESPDITRCSYFFTEMRVIVTYMRLMVLPVNQSIDYPFELAKSIMDLKTLASMLFLALIIGIGIWLHLRCAMASLGILWFFIFIIVESTIIPIADPIFEHRIYLSSIGFITAIVGLIYYMAKPSHLKIAIPFFVAATVVLSVAAYERNHAWSDEVTLWQNAIASYPSNQRAYVNLGSAFLDKERYSDVIKVMEHLFSLDPNHINNPFYIRGHGNLGLAYARMGMYDKALHEFLTIIKIDPHIGVAYAFGANVYVKQNKIDEAMELLQRGRAVDPDNPIINAMLGTGYCQQGNADTAISFFQHALAVSPNYRNGHLSLAFCLLQINKLSDARIHYFKSIELNPDSPDPYFFIAVTYDQEANHPKAAEYYQLFLDQARLGNPLIPHAQSRIKELR